MVGICHRSFQQHQHGHRYFEQHQQKKDAMLNGTVERLNNMNDDQDKKIEGTMRTGNFHFFIFQ